MFNSVRKRVDETVASNDIETVVGKSTCIRGEISGDGNVRIDGRVEGGITIQGNVVIGESGVVKGDISAANLVISGSITGNADIKGNLAIYATGQLIGDVKVKSLNIDDGGIFKGRSEMTVRVQEKDSVVVAMKQGDKKNSMKA